jgi:hypothetical protein
LQYSTTHGTSVRHQDTESPVLNLGQAILSREELDRLKEKERMIDEAIRESERRAHTGVQGATEEALEPHCEIVKST